MGWFLKENEIENSLYLVVTMNPRRFTEILSNFVGMECAWREGSKDFREEKWLNSSVSKRSK